MISSLEILLQQNEIFIEFELQWKILSEMTPTNKGHYTVYLFYRNPALSLVYVRENHDDVIK